MPKRDNVPAQHSRLLERRAKLQRKIDRLQVKLNEQEDKARDERLKTELTSLIEDTLLIYDERSDVIVSSLMQCEFGRCTLDAAQSIVHNVYPTIDVHLHSVPTGSIVVRKAFVFTGDEDLDVFLLKKHIGEDVYDGAIVVMGKDNAEVSFYCNVGDDE